LREVKLQKQNIKNIDVDTSPTPTHLIGLKQKEVGLCKGIEIEY